MNKKVFIFPILLLSAVFLSGCTANQQQIAINLMTNAIDSVNDFDSVVYNTLAMGAGGIDNPYDIMNFRMKWLAPDYLYIECFSDGCWFSLNNGDKLITDGKVEWRYSASSNTYVKETPGDFTAFTLRALHLKSNLGQMLDMMAALGGGGFAYNGTKTVNGQTVFEVVMSWTSVYSDGDSYTTAHTTEYIFYIRASDFMPIGITENGYTNDVHTWKHLAVAKELNVNIGLTPADFNPEVVFAGATETE